MGQDASTEDKPKAKEFLQNITQPSSRQNTYQQEHSNKKRVQFSPNTQDTSKKGTGQPPQQWQQHTPPTSIHSIPEQNHHKKRVASPDYMNQRVAKFYQQKQEQIERLKNEALQREMQECTFTPQINEENLNIRSTEEFMHYQKEFLKRKAQKIESLRYQKDQVESAMLKQFELNKQSRDMLKPSNDDLYTRLMKKKKELEVRLEEERKPITIQNPKISEEDRKLITERLLKPLKKVDQTEGYQVSSQTPRDPKILKKLKKRLQRELKQVCEELQIGNPINKEQALSIMIYMSYIKKENTQQFDDVFEQMSKDKMTSQEEIFKVMCGIEGIQVENQDLEPTIKMHQQFYQYYLNRLLRPCVSLKGDFPSPREFSSFKVNSQNIKYKKEINQNQIKYNQADVELNEKLAENFRNKILDEYKKIAKHNNEQLAYEDYLNFIDKSSKMKVEDLRQKRDTEKQKDCTFKPRITSYNSPPTQKQKHPTYTMGPKQRSALLAQTNNFHMVSKDPSISEWEKNKNECTFTPSINKYTPSGKDITVNNFDETIERMRQARKVQENVNNFLARSEQDYFMPNKFLKPQLPRPSAPIRHHTRTTFPDRAYSEPRTEPPKPILFIDIKIGNANDRITLYEGENLDFVAQQFLKKHGQTMELQGKLKQMLQQHVDNLSKHVL